MTWRLLVAGVALGGDGYPNARNTVALLKAGGAVDVRDHANWLPDHVRLWHLVRGPLRKRLPLLLRLGMAGLVQAGTLMLRARGGQLVYLPYPAPITLWWLSFVPKRWRPRCIADAYVSLWDSMFRDRLAGRAEGLVSRMLYGIERRSLRAATLVLADTEANRRQFIADFALAPEQVRSMPLAIDERPFRSRAGPVDLPGKPARVLFVGTLVPLHGVEIVLAAARELGAEREVEFRLIGDGQQSDLVEAFVRDGAPENFAWIREWKPLEEIADEIAAADVCLGVFGGAGKASRVLPFKLYYALAAGKAIVTQAGYSLPADLPPLPVKLVATEDKGEAVKQLVEAIRGLLGNAEGRSRIGLAAQGYFNRHLSADAIGGRWEEIISRD